MGKILTCRACRADLSGMLTILSTKDPAVTVPEYRNGEPFGPPGVAYKSWKPLAKAFDGPPVSLGFVPQFWLNPADVAGRVRNTTRRCRGELRPLNGCCGIAGLNGPNQQCLCGAGVGTLQSDCFTPHVFVPEPGATEWQNE